MFVFSYHERKRNLKSLHTLNKGAVAMCGSWSAASLCGFAGVSSGEK